MHLLQGGDKTLIRLTQIDGEPLLLRRAFILCVLQEEHDTQIRTDRYACWYVKEGADHIDAPRCTARFMALSRATHIKIDPHLIVALEGRKFTRIEEIPKEKDSAKWSLKRTRKVARDTHYTEIHAQMPNGTYTYSIQETPEEAERILTAALKQWRDNRLDL